jgi:uncharacterized protein YdeI (YjbR/CyaY-like superfamily)
MKPRFFRSAAEFRAWLAANHAKASELMVGFYKVASGKGGITYREAVDEALCFGWIDGVRRGIDDDRYENRFTPRKPKSYWSDVNTKRAKELIAEGRMAPPGLAAYERRDASETRRYSFERDAADFDAAQKREFRAAKTAWAYFSAQPPGYRKVAIWWVVSAKREDTRARRLATLIEHSRNGERLPQVTSPAARGGQ